MKNAKKIIAVVLAAILVCVAFAGCKKAADSNATTEKKVLKLATSADFPPYEFVGEGGGYEGIDIEISREIAKKLGYDDIQVENMDFDSIIPAVTSGKCDMAMAGLTVTEERAQSVDFSNPYAKGVQAVIVKADSPIKTVDDLYAGTSYKVGVQLATTGDIYFQGDIDDAKTTCTLEKFTTGAEAVESLKQGKLDAVIIDNQPATKFVEANEGLKVLETEYANEDYAIALAKGSELTEQVNKALEELKADGTIDKIVAKYIPAN